MIKKIFAYIAWITFSIVIFTGCCAICTSIENDEGKWIDLDVSNDNIEFQTGLGWSFVGGHAFLEFYENFLYGFGFLVRDSSYYETMGNPDIIINNLSFTTTKGDTIPYDLYYYNCNNLSSRNGKCGVDIINQSSQVFPLKITRDMKESESVVHRYKIFALSQISTNKLKKIYVNYDIEVYGKHYVVHSLYKDKVKFDCRPKIW